METQFSRTEMLFGAEAMERLYAARVAVFGVGGVGGFAVEALARSGIGSFLLVDSDVVALSNLNRQIIATHRTVGKYKVDVMKDRILDINPKAQVEVRRMFYLPENADQFDLSAYSYVVDAVDTVAAKLELVIRSKQAGVPVISAMGAGNKLFPDRFEVDDISRTSVCPLARVMRKELRLRGIEQLKVVYSKEPAKKPDMRGEGMGKRTPGSTSFVPSSAGLVMAGEVIRDIAGL